MSRSQRIRSQHITLRFGGRAISKQGLAALIKGVETYRSSRSYKGGFEGRKRRWVIHDGTSDTYRDNGLLLLAVVDKTGRIAGAVRIRWDSYESLKESHNRACNLIRRFEKHLDGFSVIDAYGHYHNRNKNELLARIADKKGQGEV